MRPFAPVRVPVLLTLSLCAFATPAAAADPGPVKPGGAAAAAAAQAPDRWAAFRGFLGVWEGTSRGAPGTGTVRREYRLVLGDRFIEVRNASTYPPQEGNREGELHEDVGYISLDRARSVHVLRQFHLEGFVNTYAAPAGSPPASPLVFTSEAIENIAPGWRARETYRFEGPDELVEVFELAAPGKDFTTYTEARLKRVR
ncbi:hypothetical protein AnaeK_0580 [Anaeromyxobacter sp. K]|uniref:hypothetical protein n=1 Tax=Anaeromyxobacter sp. (strain K) TaxID=447217 RepID=UPI00015F9E87|nr:hypothetical protein [Anaeromyxobacter sp. K]ACG71819.1 hypothetical protein AnaeK_0580 [Anaeromyxobacter sp. K]